MLFIKSVKAETKKKIFNLCFLFRKVNKNKWNFNERSKEVKYYQTSIRTYYIFETNPGLIESSQEITLTIIRRLTSKKYRSLTLEI